MFKKQGAAVQAKQLAETKKAAEAAKKQTAELQKQTAELEVATAATQKQTAELQRQLAAAEDAKKQTAELQKQTAELQRQPKVAQPKAQVPTIPRVPRLPDPVVQVLQNHPEGSMVLHMWTGEAATIHETNAANARARIGPPPRSREVRIGSTEVQKVRREEFDRNINYLQNKICTTEQALTLARIQLNSGSLDPDKVASTVGKIRRMATDLDTFQAQINMQ